MPINRLNQGEVYPSAFRLHHFESLSHPPLADFGQLWHRNDVLHLLGSGFVIISSGYD